MYFRYFGVMVLLAAPLGACATVAEGSTQPIYVSTGSITGANCELSNARGTWSVTTPGSVVVAKSDSVLTAHCTKDGWRDAKDYFASKVPTSAMIGMMLPYAGIVSAAVDGSTGAANEYPDTISVTMQQIEPAAPAAVTAPSPPGIQAASQK